jgi:hypothetical protein
MGWCSLGRDSEWIAQHFLRANAAPMRIDEFPLPAKLALRVTFEMIYPIAPLELIVFIELRFRTNRAEMTPEIPRNLRRTYFDL